MNYMLLPFHVSYTPGLTLLVSPIPELTLICLDSHVVHVEGSGKRCLYNHVSQANGFRPVTFTCQRPSRQTWDPPFLSFPCAVHSLPSHYKSPSSHPSSRPFHSHPTSNPYTPATTSTCRPHSPTHWPRPSSQRSRKNALSAPTSTPPSPTP